MTDILEDFAQSGLRFLPSEADEKRTGLRGILDKINNQHGSHTVRYAVEGSGTRSGTWARTTASHAEQQNGTN